MGEVERKRILLVEDDATISDLVSYNLRRAGYEVLQERNGRAGLEAALHSNIDLVLMDLMLPGLDGMAASRESVNCRLLFSSASTPARRWFSASRRRIRSAISL